MLRHVVAEVGVTTGRIYSFVRFLEQRHTAFSVARLIMLSGVPVRKFGPDSEDDDAAIRRIDATLPALLGAEHVDEARARLRSTDSP